MTRLKSVPLRMDPLSVRTSAPADPSSRQRELPIVRLDVES